MSSDAFAEIAAAAGDAAKLLEIAMRLAGEVAAHQAADVKAAARRTAARDKKRRQRAGQAGTSRDNAGQRGTSPLVPGTTAESVSESAAHKRAGLALTSTSPVQAQDKPGQELFPGSAKASPGSATLVLEPEETPASGIVPPRTRAKRKREASPAIGEAAPSAWYDRVHAEWTKLAGVVNVGRFRAQLKPAFAAGYTVGQICRAMDFWVWERTRQRRPIVLEYFLGELGAAVKAQDQGSAMFVIPAADLGMTAEEASARQAAFLARLAVEDAAEMDQLRTPPPTNPAPLPLAPAPGAFAEVAQDGPPQLAPAG